MSTVPTPESDAEYRFRAAVNQFISDYREAVRAQEQHRAPSQDSGNWQPIETAPQDGTPILAFDSRTTAPADRFTCFWRKDAFDPDAGIWQLCRPGFYSEDAEVKPTYWMPLHPAP